MKLVQITYIKEAVSLLIFPVISIISNIYRFYKDIERNGSHKYLCPAVDWGWRHEPFLHIVEAFGLAEDEVDTNFNKGMYVLVY